MAIQAQLCTDNIGFLPLCGSQDWIEGYGGYINGGFNQFCFGQQQSQQQQIQQQQYIILQQQNQQRNQSVCFDNNNNNNNLAFAPSSKTHNNHHQQQQSMAYCSSFMAQAEKHRQEIDHYIKSQNERLRSLLQEQRKKELAVLLKRIESKASILLRQKDEEIAQARKRAMELENFLKKLEMENQRWQRVAQESEAMVVSLNNTLEQLRESPYYNCCFNNGAEDAESCCDIEEQEEETEQQNRGFFFVNGGNKQEVVKEEEERKLAMLCCKSCNSQNAVVLFLPCRHLCSCKACEASLDSCPICGMPKKATIEALIF